MPHPHPHRPIHTNAKTLIEHGRQHQLGRAQLSHIPKETANLDTLQSISVKAATVESLCITKRHIEWKSRWAGKRQNPTSRNSNKSKRFYLIVHDEDYPLTVEMVPTIRIPRKSEIFIKHRQTVMAFYEQLITKLLGTIDPAKAMFYLAGCKSNKSIKMLRFLATNRSEPILGK